MKVPGKPCLTILVVAALLGLVAAPTAAAPILNIQFTGLNLHYDGSQVYDATSAAGGTGTPAESDPLDKAVFTLTSDVGVKTILGTLTADLFADVLVDGLMGLPVDGGSVTTSGNGNGFGVDLLTTPAASAAWGLALVIDTVNATYAGDGGSLSLRGTASLVGAQALPYGLQVDTSQSVRFSFVAPGLTNITTAGGQLESFDFFGSGSITATPNATPEPCTLLLAALGLAGMLAARRRMAI